MINLTEKSAKELKQIIKEQNLPVEKTKLRVGVQGGGCSGFKYTLDLVEEDKQENDELFNSLGVDILVDIKSHIYLDGTTVDFKDEIMGRGFVFNNPQSTGSCGCGHSFSA